MKIRAYLYGICIVVIIIVLFWEDGNQKEEITKQVRAIDGEIVEIDSLGLFEHDPLPYGGKGASKYKFIYKQKGQTKIGYVCFGWNDTWIMEDKEAN